MPGLQTGRSRRARAADPSFQAGAGRGARWEAISLRSPALGSKCSPLLFLDDMKIARVIDILNFALAFKFDAQPQLILRISITQGVLVGNHTGFKELKERLIEGLHAKARGARHDFLDLGDVAFEDEVLDERRVQHDFHGGDTAGTGLARNEALRHERADVER